jgi:hypothetical protein
LRATLAQSAEQRIRNAQVVGSIPTGGSIRYPTRLLEAFVLRLVLRASHKAFFVENRES